MKRFASMLALALVVFAQSASAQTLKAVTDRGILNCGANGTLAGFGLPDAQGKWTGLDVDVCRAIAAAIFNDANKVKFVPLSAKDRFTALQSGEVDVLVAQHHLDLVARHFAGPELHRRRLLRRPGLHGAQGAQSEFGARA